MSVTEVTLSDQSLGRSAFDQRMKEVYLPKWEDFVNNQTKILKMFPKTGTMLGGRRSLTSVLYNNPQSAGIAFLEDDLLAEPTSPSSLQLEIIARALNCRIRITGHVRRAGRIGDKGVFSDPFKELMRTARQQHINNKNRMLIQGNHDFLGVVQSYTHDATAANNRDVVLYGRNTRTSDTDDLYRNGSHYIREGMHLAFITPSGTSCDPDGDVLAASQKNSSNSDMARVVSIDASDAANPTLTITGTTDNVDWSSTDDGALVIPYASRANSTGAEAAGFDSLLASPNGFNSLIADATIKTFVYGASRSTYSFLESEVVRGAVSGTVEAYNEDHITLCCDLVAENQYNAGEEVDIMSLHTSVRREHTVAVKEDRRFAEVVGNRGWKLQAFQAGDKLIPLVTDKDVPPGTIYGYPKASLGMFVESPLHDADDGARFVSNKDAHEHVLVESFNTACRVPSATFRKEDIEYSTTGLL